MWETTYNVSRFELATELTVFSKTNQRHDVALNLVLNWIFPSISQGVVITFLFGNFAQIIWKSIVSYGVPENTTLDNLHSGYCHRVWRDCIDKEIKHTEYHKDSDSD
jgi:hypothetical protein